MRSDARYGSLLCSAGQGGERPILYARVGVVWVAHGITRAHGHDSLGTGQDAWMPTHGEIGVVCVSCPSQAVCVAVRFLRRGSKTTRLSGCLSCRQRRQTALQLVVICVVCSIGKTRPASACHVKAILPVVAPAKGFSDWRPFAQASPRVDASRALGCDGRVMAARG